ncbi:MAG: helix-turn-helix domain-containing protein, partial [Sulfurimicrobium sp.]|nr:helix-turn-helix domain-containing protein [Sulfurimicrobium sp.]
ADLYFRINVVSIFLPPLRERRDDIPPLLEHFLEKFNQENKRKLAISEDAMESIVNCGWPGNVRELENCVERMATMTRGNLIRRADLLCQKGLCFSSALRNYGATHPSIPILAEAEHQTEMPTRAAATDVPAPQDEAELLTERERLMWAMEKSGWVQAKAARLLDLTPRQMGYALKKYDIDIKRF